MSSPRSSRSSSRAWSRKPRPPPTPAGRRSPATAADRVVASKGRRAKSRAALVEFAPAKVNLTLRVLGRRADGYHSLDSLVAFADIGDRLSLVPGATLSLTVRGRNAKAAGKV